LNGGDPCTPPGSVAPWGPNTPLPLPRTSRLHRPEPRRSKARRSVSPAALRRRVGRANLSQSLGKPSIRASVLVLLCASDPVNSRVADRVAGRSRGRPRGKRPQASRHAERPGSAGGVRRRLRLKPCAAGVVLDLHATRPCSGQRPTIVWRCSGYRAPWTSICDAARSISRSSSAPS